MGMMPTVWVLGSSWKTFRKPTQGGKYQTPQNSLIIRNSAKLQGETCRIIGGRRKKVTTHLETSLLKTFRVGEGEVEVEEEALEEEATNPTIEVGASRDK